VVGESPSPVALSDRSLALQVPIERGGTRRGRSTPRGVPGSIEGMSDPRQTPAVAPWSLETEETIGDYRIFQLTRSVRRSPRDGRESAFVRIDAPNWVNVVALTGEGRLLLIEQYRHGADAITIEIPGGTVDEGETPAQAIARELEEETGYVPAELHPLGRVEPNPAFQSNTCWTYLGLGCTFRGNARPDPSEEIAVRLSSLAEFTALIDSGTIRHALVVAAHDHLRRALARRDPRTAALAPWL